MRQTFIEMKTAKRHEIEFRWRTEMENEKIPRKVHVLCSSSSLQFDYTTIPEYSLCGEGKGKKQDKSKEISNLNIHDFFCFSSGEEDGGIKQG